MEVTMFIWDQCLCSKLKMLLPLCAALLTLVRTGLLGANSVSVSHSVLFYGTRTRILILIVIPLDTASYGLNFWICEVKFDS